ncbi:hypothetical protein CH063_03112 [Colletotrichum higginsianum]|uniref:2EXR domain-containing protein n=2 Tax=Colletotrichum higginsianum TaxID=80884 RepID=H1VTN1_COLHI|nr:hypothetical protein CH63R_00402 [Colletotrichum higginsianum IMI 349063]OBR15222.1 hypothetical protein CH63R_00402 [Colletotrichum higginsianum IMI 349063]CCF43589.1 hypothetical protein CH063_03112 [Colletotrichum higginsianum]
MPPNLFTHSPTGVSRPATVTGAAFPVMKLPVEIRLMIWEYALPDARVYEAMDSPNASQKTPAAAGLMFANVRDEPPPALGAVCHETRVFVLQRYRPLTLSATTKYVDLSRDILLLEPYLLVKRLLRTLQFFSQISLVRDNLSRLAFGTSYGLYTGICHPVLSWKVSKSNMTTLLARLAKFPRLRKLLFVVHQEFQFDFDVRPPCATHQMSHPEESRPQLVHQGYRFKFDIESQLNYTQPRHPHSNEFLYYPLDIDEDNDECFDRDDLEGEGDPYESWPTNDDWRRFRRRFQRSIHLVGKGSPGISRPNAMPTLEAASLLWRYSKAQRY